MIRKGNRADIGRMNQKILVYQAEPQDDGMGGQTGVDNFIYSTFGDIQPMKANRQYLQDRALQNTTHEILMRFTPVGGKELPLTQWDTSTIRWDTGAYFWNALSEQPTLNNTFRLISDDQRFIINAVRRNNRDRFILHILATAEALDVTD